MEWEKKAADRIFLVSFGAAVFTPFFQVMVDDWLTTYAWEFILFLENSFALGERLWEYGTFVYRFLESRLPSMRSK